MSVLLYTCEIWTSDRLVSVCLSFYWIICGITLHDNVRNKVILKLCSTVGAKTCLGHIHKMNDSILPKKLLFGHMKDVHQAAHKLYEMMFLMIVRS